MRRSLYTFFIALTALTGVVLMSSARADAAPTDVVFVFDTTGSMDSTLSAAQSQATSVMSDLRSRLGGDVHFGLAEMRDYPIDPYGDPGDLPWRLTRAITSDTATIKAGIDGLSAGGGNDSPESYGRALWEAERDPAVGWRPGARRLLVLIADDVPHDDNLNVLLPADQRMGDPWNTNPDPGPDGAVGTSDDLDWDRNVLPQLRDNGLKVAMVLVQNTEYLEQWRTWARFTGGDAVDGAGVEFSSAVIGIAESVARAPDPPCPAGQARNAAGRCASTTAIVFVSGLGSRQRFADTNSVAICENAGTWQQTAADIAPFPQIVGRYQVFLAPMDKANTGEADCDGVAASPDAVTAHMNSTRYSDYSINGSRLTEFLAFLNRSYGITDAYLVGHSYGGIWSRAALTRLGRSSSPAVRIRGIVAVGTPHTGSFAADAIESLRISCDRAINPAKIAVGCLSFGGVNLAFGEAVDGLTSSALRAWNPSQSNRTPWGCVPVGNIAGTAIKEAFVGGSGSFYAPHDGVVGLSSALADGASITGPRELGRFDMVHVKEFELFGRRVMTTDAEVLNKILTFVTSSPTCLDLSGSTLAEHSVGVAVARDHATVRPRALRVPFVGRPGGRSTSGLLPRPAGHSDLFLTGTATASCAGRRLAALPVLGLPSLRLVSLRGCRAANLQIAARGKGSGASVVTEQSAGVTVKNPRRGRLTVSLFGVRRGKATALVTTLSGRGVAKAILEPGRATTLRIKTGRYKLTVTDAAARRIARSIVRS